MAQKKYINANIPAFQNLNKKAARKNPAAYMFEY